MGKNDGMSWLSRVVGKFFDGLKSNTTNRFLEKSKQGIEKKRLSEKKLFSEGRAERIKTGKLDPLMDSDVILKGVRKVKRQFNKDWLELKITTKGKKGTGKKYTDIYSKLDLFEQSIKVEQLRNSNPNVEIKYTPTATSFLKFAIKNKILWFEEDKYNNLMP
ncbi:hypothetical protein N9523_02960 [Flavobacteriaceae bacterium]|nr:hypothetical protein [Flavobacteriaceae bacterium]